MEGFYGRHERQRGKKKKKKLDGARATIERIVGADLTKHHKALGS